METPVLKKLNKKLTITIVADSVKDIIPMLPGIALEILGDYIAGHRSLSGDRDIEPDRFLTFNWKIDLTEDQDVYGNREGAEP